MSENIVTVVKEKRRLGCFGKGCGCLVAGFVGLFLLGAGTSFFEERKTEKEAEKKRVEAAAFQEKMCSVAAEKAPELIDAIQELEVIEQDVVARVQKLSDILEDMNKEPKSDPDYRQWMDELNSIRDAQKSLQNDLEQLYLTYQKYIISPNDKLLKKKMEQLRRQGSSAAKDAKRRYQALKDSSYAD